MTTTSNVRGKYHPLAIVETDDIGAETRVWAFAHVMAGAKVGCRCNLGEGVFIEGGVVIGNDVTIKNGVAVYDKVVVEDDVFLGPHCVFTNDLRPRSGRFKKSAETFAPTRIKRGATIGANATVVCGHEVGEYAMVAAGAVVTQDVAPYVLVGGVPARPMGFVCACGESLTTDLRCRCGRAYRRLDRGLEPVASPSTSVAEQSAKPLSIQT